MRRNTMADPVKDNQIIDQCQSPDIY